MILDDWALGLVTYTRSFFMKKFTPPKGGLLHQLCTAGSSKLPVRERKAREITVWAFVRRSTLGVMYNVYLGTLMLVSLCFMFIMIEVPAAVLTFLTNCVTIPLGFGISMLYPEKKFLQLPFEVNCSSGKRNLGWVVVPIWIFVINFWNMAYGDFRSLTTGIVFMWTIIAVLIYFRALSIAKMDPMYVEFVDPPVEAKTTKA